MPVPTVEETTSAAEAENICNDSYYEQMIEEIEQNQTENPAVKLFTSFFHSKILLVWNKFINIIISFFTWFCWCQLSQKHLKNFDTLTQDVALSDDSDDDDDGDTYYLRVYILVITI